MPRPIAVIRLDGGRLCIDFVNTIHDRYAVAEEDYLSSPERYVEWSRRTGALSDDEDVSFAAFERTGTSLMVQIRTLREAINDLLMTRINSGTVSPESLAIVNYWLLEARKDQAFASDGQLLLRAAHGDPTLPLKRISLDLVDTLAATDIDAFRLARCANGVSCGWIFADTSKNRRRRWCSMQTCGTLSKMAASRQRSLAEAKQGRSVNTS